jgi:MFS family permease
MLDLLPDRAGVISGMRGMCRSTGGIVGTALIVVMLETSADKAASLRMMFLLYGLVLVAAIPLTAFIPETPRKQPDRGGSQTAPLAADPAR